MFASKDRDYGGYSKAKHVLVECMEDMFLVLQKMRV